MTGSVRRRVSWELVKAYRDAVENLDDAIRHGRTDLDRLDAARTDAAIGIANEFIGSYAH